MVVVGCSDQIQDELRAYHLVSATENGDLVLSRHDGVTYTGTMDHLSPYCEVLTRMVDSVLEHLRPVHRGHARAALVVRWNRAWAVTRLRETCATCERACRDDRLGSTDPEITPHQAHGAR